MSAIAPPTTDRPMPATPAQRTMIAAIFATFALLALGLLWLVVYDVATRYRLTCTRTSGECVVVREQLGGDMTYRVALSPGTRPVVETTHPRRGTPRVFLELATAGERRAFLVEYEGPSALDRANAAAARLDALLAGAGEPVVEETVGSPAVSWGLVAAVVALLAGIGAAYRAVRTRLGARGDVAHGERA